MSLSWVKLEPLRIAALLEYSFKTTFGKKPPVLGENSVRISNWWVCKAKRSQSIYIFTDPKDNVLNYSPVFITIHPGSSSSPEMSHNHHAFLWVNLISDGMKNPERFEFFMWYTLSMAMEASLFLLMQLWYYVT